MHWKEFIGAADLGSVVSLSGYSLYKKLFTQVAEVQATIFGLRQECAELLSKTHVAAEDFASLEREAASIAPEAKVSDAVIATVASSSSQVGMEAVLSECMRQLARHRSLRRLSMRIRPCVPSFRGLRRRTPARCCRSEGAELCSNR